MKRDLFEEMFKDGIVIEYLKDHSIAVEFYQALCNVEWKIKSPPIPEDEQIIKRLKGEDEECWGCSWRSAGGYIAAIRNRYHNTNESYLDFYCFGDEGIVTDRVKECFDRMGWVQKT